MRYLTKTIYEIHINVFGWNKEKILFIVKSFKIWIFVKISSFPLDTTNHYSFHANILSSLRPVYLFILISFIIFEAIKI